MKLRATLAAAIAIAFVMGGASAATIVEDFEDPPVGVTPPNPAYTNPTGLVEIYTGDLGDDPMTFSDPSYVAEFGAPETAFVPDDMLASDQGGDQFLTDEENGPDLIKEYLFEFMYPITSLSMDVYDFRRDGTPDEVGPDTLALQIWDGGGWVTVDDYTLMGTETDGWTLNLSASGFETKYAALIYSEGEGDNGMGVDNLKFNVVPEPATITLLGLGIAGIAMRRRFSK